MPTATVTSKGQITIPQKVRAEMGLSPGDRVEFLRMEGGRYMVAPAAGSVRSLKGSVPRPAEPVSLEAMQAAILAGSSGS